eukprot:14359406-Alexandrium_andersonii.AAC.1
MSASLVGSEMCIRDRDRTPPFGMGAGRGFQPSVPGVAIPTQLEPSQTMAVSYTHLTLPTICSV